jgi:hypothetical protein
VQNTTAIAKTVIRPVTFRLPKPGSSDPHFNFTRSFYYQLEKRGVLKLLHVCDEGRKRGITLIPYEQVAAFVRSKIQESNGGFEGTVREHASENRRGQNAIPKGIQNKAS